MDFFKNTLIEQKILKEEIGVNSDVRILSDFLFFELTHRPFSIGSTITLNQNDLPETTNITINELNISRSNCENKTTNALNLTTSQQNDNNTYDINIILCDVNIETIYHEINHVLQFILRGKSKSIKNTYLSKSAEILNTILNDPNIDIFIDMLLKSRESEINSLVVETYPLIQNKINVDDAMKILKDSNAYKISVELINYDIFENFENTDEFVLGTFFNNIDLIFDSLNGENKHETVKTVLSLIELINGENFKPPYIEVTQRQMTRYNKLIHHRGNKLQKKLYRLLSFV